MTSKTRRIGLAAAAGLLVVAVGIRLSAEFVPLPSGFIASGSTVVTYRDGSFAHVFVSSDEKWRIDARVDEVDPQYVQALLQLEDKRFFLHSGVDARAAVRAAWTNLWRGRVVSGASTLTMQLVRVREPRPRTLLSKLVEVYRAWQVEARYDKEAILAHYLTYIPFGRNIEGIEAASMAYFGHRPERLSPDEIATLLAVPQNPTARYPSPANAERLKTARDDIALRLGAVVATDRAEQAEKNRAAILDEVRRAPVVRRMAPFPRRAKHLAYWLKARHPRAARIPTTLDRGVQTIAQKVLQEAGERVRNLGIHNGVAVVVDHATAKVAGLIGNFDFWDDVNGGQIPGFVQARSPGSTLKPFLYALAIDGGHVLPEHLVADVPHRYGTYAPKNYDGGFDGLVRLEDALARSLNVPFVDILADVGVDPFIGHLGAWGVRSIRADEGFYGLSAAIGGLELTPLELAGLYVMLARGGHYRPVRLQPSQGRSDALSMFAEGTAFLTQRALRSRDRPDFPSRFRWSGVPPHIHWKTGTSYGHRDAWAAGSDDRLTVVVWMGNFDNTPSRHLVGAEVAGPVLFDVLEALSAGRSPPEQAAAPDDLTRVEVCRFSGHRPTQACPHRTHVWALTRRVPTKPCPYHVSIDVDRTTGLALRPGCRGDRAYDTRAFLRLPSGVRRWMAGHRRDLPTPPNWAEGCQPKAARPPHITSPAAGQTALMLPGVPAERQEIPLQADSDALQLSWFVDGTFLGTFPADRTVWWTPSLGRHEVVVLDEAGLTSRRAFKVGGGAGL